MNIKLELMSGAQDGEEFRFKRSATIGRDKSNEIPLVLDKYISRRHATLEVNDNSVILEDMESTNGTFYDGRRISERITLENGDFFRVGRTWVRIDW